MKHNIFKNNIVPVFCMSLLACMCTGAFYIVTRPRRFTCMIVLLMIAYGLFVYCIGKRKKIDISRQLLYLGLGISFLIRADYIIYTPTWIRQHDVIGFGAGFGQAGLIEYFYEKIRLIDFDPREYWGYFQPPLHHMLAGLWLRLQVLLGSALGFSYNRACEAVQQLTLFYSLCINIATILILKKLKIKDFSLALAALLVAMHPCFIIMSGSINNDILCIALQLFSVYFFICYIQEDGRVSLYLSGLFLGLSMMAKLSGIMLAPAIGMVLLIRLINDIKNKSFNITKYLIEYGGFGLISIPLGIWSPVRNYICFGVPLNYTPKVGEPIEGVTLLARFINIYTKTPFTCMIDNGSGYDEFNIPLTLLKTSIFGEYDFSNVFVLATITGWLLLLFGTVLCVLIIYVTIVVALDKRSSLLGQMKVFLLVYEIVSILFIVNLCVTIPNFSSQDFRYIAHIIPVEGVFAGCYIMNEHYNKYIKYVLSGLIIGFATISLLMYLMVGMVCWN